MNPATASDEGLAEVIHSEAIVTGPYFDSVGVLTDGIGHTKSAGGHDPAENPLGTLLPLEYILKAFRQDIRTYERRTAKALTGPTNQHEFDAFFSFDLNTGAVNRAQCVKSHNAGHKAQAAAEFMNWVKPPELRGRRQRERDLYERGIYSSGGKALLVPASQAGRPMYSAGRNIDVMPAIRSLKQANKADAAGDSAKTNVTTGATTAVSSTAATTIPVNPDTGQTSVDFTAIPNLKFFIIALAIAGVAFAIYYLFQFAMHRSRANALTRVAANFILMTRRLSEQMGVPNAGTISDSSGHISSLGPTHPQQL